MELNTYYIHFVIIGAILAITIVFLILRKKSSDLKADQSITMPNRPEVSSIFSITSNLKTAFSLYQMLINANPEILSRMVSDNTPEKEHIINEIRKFHQIKNFKAIDAKTMEITVKFESGPEHTYRATREDERKNSKIISLKRLS